MSDEVEAAIEVVRGIRPGESPFDHPALRAMFARARADATGLDAMVRALVPALALANSYRASCIAISCGTLVEHGADPRIAGLAIVERLLAALAAPPNDPNAIVMFDRAAMAHLCRGVELRVAARALPTYDPRALAGTFTGRLLDCVDELELLVLVPAQTRGFRIRLEAVATNAHLFTLLQGALAATLGMSPVDPAILGIATGELAMTERVLDGQRFRFETWRGLASPTELQPGLGASLWVDGSPRDIPALPDGRRVVLLGPPLLGGRTWDSGFFANLHDALRSRAVIVAELSPDEVRAELAAILRVG